MTKPPYFPFYPRDFSSDAKVEAMSTEEVGAYVLLLCKAWQEEPAGSIPSDDTVLARWARLDAASWARCRTAVLAPFVLGTDGRYHQKRMRKEFAKFRAIIRARSEAGKKGASKRWSEFSHEVAADGVDSTSNHGETSGGLNGKGNGKAIGNANGKMMAPGSGSVLVSSSSDPSSTSSPSEKKEEKKKGGARARGGAGGGDLPPDFLRFWAAWPKKVAKEAAIAAWAKLAPGPELLETLLAALERQKLWPKWHEEGGKYIPNPATWLNGRRWEDQVKVDLPPPRPVTESTADGISGIVEQMRKEFGT